MKHLVIAETGLLPDSQWEHHLSCRPLSLVRRIRKLLEKQVPGLAEKFNRNLNYFGYRAQGGSDFAYIYVRKKDLRIDLRIDRRHEPELARQGFTVKYVNNFQGRAGWLTGWHVPHDDAHAEAVVNWILKAFHTTSLHKEKRWHCG